MLQQWRQLIEARTGMVVEPNRTTFLQTNLASRMRELGLSDYAAYYKRITEAPDWMVEWSVLVDRLTVQETRFFRDTDALRTVEKYIAELPRQQLSQTPLEAWSVGCATGEEVYTLCILINEALTQRGLKPKFGVTGTDISTPALNKARTGIYPERRLVEVRPEIQQRYFELVRPGQYQFDRALMKKACFVRENLAELQNALHFRMQIIYCQNVLIYFKKWRRREILRHLTERLAPGGLLVLGLGELTNWQHPDLERLSTEHTLAYRKKSGAL
ncbi:MAG: methyltransferase [unclassified Hahellaceae]|nr:methyltransferase [Hahellaceae bacterium]